MRIHADSSSKMAAFSLFEIVIAMAILSMIATAVLSLLWQAGDTAAELRYLDRRDEEVNRFVMLLRESIEGLPPNATITMNPPESSESGNYELLLENTPTAFVFGETIGSAEETFIAMRAEENLDGGSSYELALSRNDFFPEDTDGSGLAFRTGGSDDLVADEQGRYWLPLLSGISGATWRYWDEDQLEWLDEWTDDEVLPPLLEFALIESFGALPQRFVFEVPDRLVNPEEESQVTTSSNQTQTQTQMTIRPASTGGGRGPSGGRPGGGRPGGGGPGGGRPGGGGPGDGGPSGGGPGDGGPSGPSGGGNGGGTGAGSGGSIGGGTRSGG
tara:strand:+ start:42875 stop:43864 length:990 start_codon:yes stop_codon:yes gene_type:complete